MPCHQKYPSAYIEPYRDGRTYIVELSRKGSRKLSCSAMPTHAPEVDVKIELQKVPLSIRRAAREHLAVAPQKTTRKA